MLSKNYRQKENLEQLELIIPVSLLKILVLPLFFLSLISTANAQQQDYSQPAKRKISVPFLRKKEN